MNRRSFFANLLGAACLAVAQRVMPASIAEAVKPAVETPLITIAPEWNATCGRCGAPAPSAFFKGEWRCECGHAFVSIRGHNKDERSLIHGLTVVSVAYAGPVFGGLFIERLTDRECMTARFTGDCFDDAGWVSDADGGTVVQSWEADPNETWTIR